MKTCLPLAILVCCTLCSNVFAQQAPRHRKPTTPATVKQRSADEIATAPDGSRAKDPQWAKRHGDFNMQSSRNRNPVVFLGDSITQGWGEAGEEAWKRHFEPMKAANFGISGDRTEHVIWRLNHGNLSRMTPKVVVILIGTNNTGHKGMDGYYSPPEQTVRGIATIVGKVRAKCLEAKVLLIGILPREKNPKHYNRITNAKINEEIAKLADGTQIVYRDFGGIFLEPDGTISDKTMPDYLHLSAEAYEKFAQALEPEINKLLGATPEAAK